MEVVGIIPVRYASKRFPGKPLIEINGKPMIQHVYEKVASGIGNVLVATDDKRIETCVKGFGGKVVTTSSDHVSGTSRCIEAYEHYSGKRNKQADIVINIQGDEPTLNSDQLDELVECFDDEKTDIATLIKKDQSIGDIFNPNIVKVVFNQNMHALYFSRSPIPYVRDFQKEEWTSQVDFYRHIGIYAFRSNVLLRMKGLVNSSLELAESLEQLNWLYHGFIIKVKETAFENIGIDTPEDLENLLEKGGI